MAAADRTTNPALILVKYKCCVRGADTVGAGSGADAASGEIDLQSEVTKCVRAAAALACLAAALATGACGARTQRAESVPPADLAGLKSVQPDVQVLILRDEAGRELVDLTYPHVVPAVQAQKDVAAITQAAGIPSSDLDISNGALQTAGAKTDEMTSATFVTVGAIPSGTTLQVEPWIVALRGYENVAITYVMSPQFVFNGLRSFQNGNVQIVLDQNGTAFTYHVHVINGAFDKLGLPLMQPNPAAVQYARTQQTRDLALRVVGLLAVSAVAAGAGYSVYILLSRLH